MIREIYDEIITTIERSFEKIAKVDYISYILFIGRGNMIPSLKSHVGTDCVVDSVQTSLALLIWLNENVPVRNSMTTGTFSSSS